MPRQPLKALPPSTTEPTISDALDAAMGGVSVAINKLLEQTHDPHRFLEVSRLATIGQAIGRQKVRQSRRVADYVPPEHRRYVRFACGPNRNLGGDDLGAVERLANNEDGEEDEGAGGYLRANPFPRRRWIGAPYGVQDDNDDDAAAQGVAQGFNMFAPVFEELHRTSERRADIEQGEADSRERLDRARELDTLTKIRDRAKTDDERLAVQGRIDAIIAELSSEDEEEGGEDEGDEDEGGEGDGDGDEDEGDEDADEGDDEPLPELDVTPMEPATDATGSDNEPFEFDSPVRHQCADCGHVQGPHWLTTAQQPRLCEHCNGPVVPRC